MEIVFDLQGFIVGNNKFILKEYAAASVQSADRGRPIVTYDPFKPPCAWKDLDTKTRQMNTFLTLHHHGLTWDCGVQAYKYVKSELAILLREEKVVKIYVKGLQKIGWLQDLIGNSYTIINLEDLGCPRLSDLKIYSIFKHSSIHEDIQSPRGELCCALDNVGRLKTWFERNWGVWEKVDIPDAPSLLTMDPEDMMYLRADFLCRSASHIYIDVMWDKLPEYLREDRRVAKYRRCREHFHLPSDMIDGLIPMMKDCDLCQAEKNQKKNKK